MAEVAVGYTAGSGTNVDAYSLPDGKVQEAVTIGNGANNGVVTAVDAFGALNVIAGVSTMFYDTFVGPLDTTDKWTTTGGAPTFSNGQLVMSATASTYNTIRTKDTIRANAGYTYVANGIQLETTAATGCGRFWGLGTNATTPAAAVLAQDGIGFEIDQAAGSLLAVTYNNGIRTTVATLTRPSDGALHRYAMYFRVTQAWWFIDGLAVAVASQAFPNVAIPELPAIVVRQNASSFTGTPVMNNTAHLTGETSRESMTLVDPIVGTRQARVKAASTSPVAADNALVVTLHPNSVTTTTASTVTGVTAAATDTALVAANVARRGCRIVNNSTAIMYVREGATAASIASGGYSFSINAGGFYEYPSGGVWAGAIRAIWSAANGYANITELT